jgi:gamma-glutamyl-gamma-aminobutyrate hydrolase PuuD
MDIVMNEAEWRSRASGHPVIGISANMVRAKWAHWDRVVTLMPQTYVDLVTSVGGIPVLLPPQPGIGETVQLLDGLLLPGGGDLDPALYEAPQHPATGRLNPRRDAAEVELARAAISTGLPVLGICRGLQVLNIVLGGTLHQHLPDIVGHKGHEPAPGTFGSQRVLLEGGSQIAKIMGGDAATVPCHHHQSIDRIGTGLTVTARSEDGVIEAAELADHPFAVAVQWHAEENGGRADSLFGALVEAARATASFGSRRAG